MKSKSIFAVLAIAVALALTINVAYAGAAKAITASIACTDSLGNPVASYLTTDNVYVKVLIALPAGSTMDLEIRNIATNTVVGPVITGALVNSINNFGTYAPGNYRVYANHLPVGSFIAAATFFVVPESMLGTLTATVAGFAAFATIGIVKRKHAKSK